VIRFPNCKINLGLQVLRKREDGYHDISTVFYPIPLHDALEAVPGDGSFTASGLPVATDASNLCLKALHLLQLDFNLPPLQLYLHKVIPMGAGLGGGSADGAFTLMLLNSRFNLGLDREQLAAYALQLGSDCPFFIYNEPCLAGGRGEVLEPLALDLSPYKLVIVNPGIHVSTPWAFGQVKPRADRPGLENIIRQPVNQWKDTLHNDFEGPVAAAWPEIAAIRQRLYDAGALYAAMSGSGATVFGIFDGDFEDVPAFPPSYFKKTLSLHLS